MTNQVLPVIQHTLSVYKTWYGYRDNIPKKSRYTLGDTIDRRFINVLDLLNRASHQGPNEKLPTLELAVSSIDTLKFFLQIAWEIHALDDKKYLALSEGLHEVGRQTGSWRKGVLSKTSAA